MNILGVQIVSALFAFFMIYVAFLHWKRKDLSGYEMFFWLILWVGFILVTINPYILQGISNYLYFFRIMDLLVVISFMILAFLGFQNYISNKKLERKIEEVIREESLGVISGKSNSSTRSNKKNNENFHSKVFIDGDKS